MLAKFSGVESERTVFKFRKRKRKFCVMFTYSIKQACEIRKFHVLVEQRPLRNVQKSVMHVQSCCFANLNLLLFCRSRCRRRRRCLSSLLLWSENFATMVTWRHTSPLNLTTKGHHSPTQHDGTWAKILNLSPERDEEHPRNFHVGFPFLPSHRRVGDVDLHRVAVRGPLEKIVNT